MQLVQIKGLGAVGRFGDDFPTVVDQRFGDHPAHQHRVVANQALAELATELGIGEFLVLGPGEKKAGGHRRASILADALEALFGAVYLDSGYESAVKVICSAFGNRLENLPDPADLRDPKTRLQEFLQSKKLQLPEYEVTETRGKAHKQEFVVTCTVAETGKQTSGYGSSRRDAEQQAADNMLRSLEVNIQ